jgi:hypothetical protein
MAQGRRTIMRRLLPILLLVTLLLALTSTVVYASPLGGQPPEPDEERTGIEDVIGALGLYAALMAVLAVGTEVVIDAVRPIFGLQRKMTSEEAFSKLREWLPGTMRDLGLPEEAENRVQATMKELENTTKDWGDNAQKALTIVQEQWPNILKDLAVQSVDELLKKYWDKTIFPQLKQAGLTEPEAEKVHAWLATTLNWLSGTSVTDLQSYLGTFNSLMDGVELQRNEIQAPLRKLWRWLRDRLIDWGEYVGGKYEEDQYVPGKWGEFGRRFVRHLLFLPAYLEYGWARLRGKLDGGVKIVEGIKKLGKVGLKPVHDLKEAAKRILEADRQQGAEEEKRIKWLRVISAVVGIVLAATLQMDSLQILHPILGSVTAALTVETEEKGGQVEMKMKTMEELLNVPMLDLRTPESKAKEAGVSQEVPLAAWDHVCNAVIWVVNWMLGLTPGLVLSGLGAAAGSGFWHDQLDKLRAAKSAIGQVQDVAKQVKELTGGGGGST